MKSIFPSIFPIFFPPNIITQIWRIMKVKKIIGIPAIATQSSCWCTIIGRKLFSSQSHLYVLQSQLLFLDDFPPSQPVPRICSRHLQCKMGICDLNILNRGWKSLWLVFVIDFVFEIIQGQHKNGTLWFAILRDLSQGEFVIWDFVILQFCNSRIHL